MVIEESVRFLESRGDFDRSLEIVRAAVAEAPNSVSFRIALAERLRVRGDLEEAEEVLLEATRSERKGTAMAAWTVISKHYMETGEFDKSVAAADEALTIGRESGIPLAQQLIDLADALLLAGQLERAMEVSEEMEVEAHKHLIQGRVHMMRGDNERALASLEQLQPAVAQQRGESLLHRAGGRGHGSLRSGHRGVSAVDPLRRPGHGRPAATGAPLHRPG